MTDHDFALLVRSMSWSDRLHDKRHRWVEIAEFKAWRWHVCPVCGLFARSYTLEGTRRFNKHVAAVTRRALVPAFISMSFAPSPIYAALTA